MGKYGRFFVLFIEKCLNLNKNVSWVIDFLSINISLDLSSCFQQGKVSIFRESMEKDGLKNKQKI